MKVSPDRSTSFSLQPIGYVESPYIEKFGTPRQPGLVADIEGAIALRPDLNPDAFEGLEAFSHAWVVFVFHADLIDENGLPLENRKVKTKVHPPRLEGKSMGVFATRSPHRPNPIGLSLVKIERIEGRKLFVRGLDLIDGTPVLDIKPYLPSVESVPDAKEGWAGTLPKTTITVQWSEQAQMDLKRAFGDEAARAKRSLEDLLQLDPRPVAYRGSVENPDPYTDLYGFRHGDWNVVYRMQPPVDGVKVAVLERIEEWASRAPANAGKKTQKS